MTSSINAKKIYKKVRAIICDTFVLNNKEIDNEMWLTSPYINLSYLDLFVIMNIIETEFNITIEEEDIKQFGFRSIKEIVELVENKFED